MELKEAIEHAEHKAADVNCCCREDHKQLAQWLKELAERRDKDKNLNLEARIMEKIIVIVFKNGQRAVWEQSEWDDYAFDGKAFIVKKDNEWVGIYNFDSIISVIVKEKE